MGAPQMRICGLIFSCFLIIAMSDAPQFPPNRLLKESSPYLRQHAYNPVDWYPWGTEALEESRNQGKPIFLSIGYSACHWCHVMAHESFENPRIAALMNEHFINIKVDREERPDLDQIYMNAVQLLTQRGGWPMSVFLTPALQPFYGGTYWPPESRHGMPGFDHVLEEVHNAWSERRGDCLKGAEKLTRAIQQIAKAEGDQTTLRPEMLSNAMQTLIRLTDRQSGGFGREPKFPHAMDLRVLLRSWRRFGNREALDCAVLTLDRMANGGIYDHLGGGFHRYSTDAKWLVPHFEKMLYDNALLTPAYLEAYQATGNPEYARVARDTLDYVLREMTQPEGGFYSTQDADSEGEEGKFFVWTADEIDRALGLEDARLFKAAYDVTPAGNWEGGTILNRPRPLAAVARELGVPESVLGAALERGRQRLLQVRKTRVAPGRDDKVLVAWNGMMISAMAMAAQVLNEPRFASAATGAADFVLTKVRDADNRLLHSYKDGVARLNAYLDDYACLIDGLVDLYQATFQSHYVEQAMKLAAQMLGRFFDSEKGGFFYTPFDHETLIARNKECHDGSTPSGNSMAATALLRLSRLTGRRDLEDTSVQTLNFLSRQFAESPSSVGQGLIALDFWLGPTYEMVLADGADPIANDAALRTLHGKFLPNKVVARRRQLQTDTGLPTSLHPLLRGKASFGSEPTLFICEHGTCQLPVRGANGVAQALTADFGRAVQ